MTPLLFALIDRQMQRDIAECRRQRAWSRRWYGRRQMASWTRDIRELRALHGAWRSLWGVL